MHIQFITLATLACFYRASSDREMCYGLVSVCLSVRLSQVDIVTQWLNVG